MQAFDLFDYPCFCCKRNSFCVTADCEKIESWLLQLISTSKIVCPECGSAVVVKHGFYKYKGTRRQKYSCKSCGFGFVPRDGFKKNFKTPQTVIEYALLLEGLSTRKISSKIKSKFNVEVSFVTVARWLIKFNAVEKKAVPKWNPQEIAQLKGLWASGKKDEEIAQILERSRAAVKIKRVRLRLVKKR